MVDYLYVSILMKKFLFSVNLYVFITIMLFMIKNYYKLLKIGIQGNGWYFFAWDHTKLHQIAAKHTTPVNEKLSSIRLKVFVFLLIMAKLKYFMS